MAVIQSPFSVTIFAPFFKRYSTVSIELLSLLYADPNIKLVHPITFLSSKFAPFSNKNFTVSRLLDVPLYSEAHIKGVDLFLS